MKFVFLFLAFAVTGVACYFTVTQTQKFQAIQDLRHTTEKENVNLSANITDRLEKIAIEEENKRIAEGKLAVAQASVENFKRENNAIENQVGTLDTKLAEQKVLIDELKQVVAGVKQEFEKLNIEVNLGSIDEDFKTVGTSIEQKQGTDKGLDESIAKEEKRLADKRAEIDRYNIRIQARDLRIAQNEIEARVSAVNHDWGFIVIGAGSNSGFMPDTKLLIKRNGRLIGTVKPSSIEPTQTIADIDFNSLAPGVRFQKGDEVILAKPANN